MKAIENDFQRFSGNVKEITNIPPEEVAALLLDPPNKLTFPLRHPIWKARGVENVGEWRDLMEQRVLREADNITEIFRVFAKAMNNKFQGKNDKAKKYSDESDINWIQWWHH